MNKPIKMPVFTGVTCPENIPSDQVLGLLVSGYQGVNYWKQQTYHQNHVPGRQK